MVNADPRFLWPYPSFLLTTNRFDSIFADVLGAPQTLTPLARDVFLGLRTRKSQHSSSALRSPVSLGVLTDARHCHAFPSRTAWFKQIRGTRGAPKCRLRSYHPRYCDDMTGSIRDDLHRLSGTLTFLLFLIPAPTGVFHFRTVGLRLHSVGDR